MAYAWNGEHHDNFDIYVKDISSPSPPLRLTTNGDIDYSPAWSPDSRWIAFCRGASEREGAIWLIHPLGGPERKLVTVNSTAGPTRRDLAWSPDSNSLIVTSNLRAGGPSQISQINIETGEAKSLVSAAPGEQYIYPALSPDGQTLAFVRDVGPGISSILLFSLISGAPPRRAAQKSPRCPESVSLLDPRWPLCCLFIRPGRPGTLVARAVRIGGSVGGTRSPSSARLKYPFHAAAKVIGDDSR